MTSRIRHVTIDCHDTFALATFWAAALGGTIHPDDHPGDPEALVTAGEHAVLFEHVPEGKRDEPRTASVLPLAAGLRLIV